MIVSHEPPGPDDLLEWKIEGGILIDWDLSKAVDPDDEQSTARQYTRTVS